MPGKGPHSPSFPEPIDNTHSTVPTVDLLYQVTKCRTLDDMRSTLKGFNLHIVSEDLGRPWGGFFVIDEADIQKFVAAFFPLLPPLVPSGDRKLSPKILFVDPGKRLSWQYHERRDEIWTVYAGQALISLSRTNKEPNPVLYTEGSMITIECGIRHRAKCPGNEATQTSPLVIAEIWKHTDPDHPSDEYDIIRIADDTGRK